MRESRQYRNLYRNAYGEIEEPKPQTQQRWYLFPALWECFTVSKDGKRAAYRRFPRKVFMDSDLMPQQIVDAAVRATQERLDGKSAPS